MDAKGSEDSKFTPAARHSGLCLHYLLHYAVHPLCPSAKGQHPCRPVPKVSGRRRCVSAHERVGLCFALVFRHSRFVIATSVDQSSRRRADCCWRERRSTQAKDCGAAFLLRLAFFLAAVSACPPGASSNKRPAWYLLAVCSPRNTPDSHHGEGYPCDVPAPPCVPHAEQQDQGHQDARCVAGLLFRCAKGHTIPLVPFRACVGIGWAYAVGAIPWALDGHMQWVQFRLVDVCLSLALAPSLSGNCVLPPLISGPSRVVHEMPACRWPPDCPLPRQEGERAGLRRAALLGEACRHQGHPRQGGPLPQAPRAHRGAPLRWRPVHDLHSAEVRFALFPGFIVASCLRCCSPRLLPHGARCCAGHRRWHGRWQCGIWDGGRWPTRRGA